MPRAVPAGLLNSPSLCTGVLVVRKDGTNIGLTDSRVPFVYNGLTYSPIPGSDASTIQQETGTSVDSMEVMTILDDVANVIKSTDIAGTLYEDSRWTMFQIDFTNPANGIMILAKYRLAKATLTDASMRMELLGLLSFLKQMTGRTYGKFCDVLRFGDKRCDPSQALRTGLSASRTVGAVQSNSVVDFFGDSRAQFFYSFGDAKFTSGLNNTLSVDIKIHTVLTPTVYAGGTTYASGDYVTSAGATYTSLQSGNTGHTPASSPTWWLVVSGTPASVARIAFREPTPYVVAVGDVATLCFGCDRRKLTCQGVSNVANPSGTNIENFHGYYLPSPDVVNVIGRSSF